MSSEKKLGITLIAILYMLAAVLFIILAIINFIPSMVYTYTSFGGELWITYLETLPIPFIGGILQILGVYLLPQPNITIIAIVLLILGAIAIIDAIGLFARKKWAHSLAVLFAVVAIVIIIGIILLWYLLKSDVKMEFGKY